MWRSLPRAVETNGSHRIRVVFEAELRLASVAGRGLGACPGHRHAVVKRLFQGRRLLAPALWFATVPGGPVTLDSVLDRHPRLQEVALGGLEVFILHNGRGQEDDEVGFRTC